MPCCERAGPTIRADGDVYVANDMFRIAAILQGIMKRVVDGTVSSAQALDAGRRARPMAELTWRYAQKVRQRKPRAASAVIARLHVPTRRHARLRRQQPASIHALMTACRGVPPAPFSRMPQRS